MSKDFVHLHTHSHYSLLDGMSKIKDLVKQAKKHEMKALAITDHGAMYGAVEFYKECKKNDIKPIIGVEAYIANRTRHDKDAGIDNQRYHLTLLAKNNIGYKNLMKLVSKAFLEGYYYKPRMDKELLEKHSEGIICLSGCPGSEFIQLLKNGHEKEARELIAWYIKIFGEENVFIEVMKHDEVEWYPPLLNEIKKISAEFKRPMVATWDSHYLHFDDKVAHDTLLAINTNNKNFKLNGDYSFISEKQAYEIYKDIPEAVSNTSIVADMVDIDIQLGDWNFPRFEVPNGYTHASLLKEKVYAGIEKRYGAENQKIKERIEFELDVIEFKGFSVYMLIVADLIDHAHENGIFTNIRGSVAGSIVTYLLGVTNVDPLALKLPFNRFLNKERPSPPDIDMDFADDRRDEIIEYARKKYGYEAVAQIGTFGKMLARGAVRDVARALGYPYGIGDRIAKLIPMGSQGFPMTIDKALEMIPELRGAYDKEKDTKEIIDLAKKIEGCARHISVHAAGVVISPSSVDDYTPIQIDPKGGKIITQYDMHAVEDVGLIKFDFLGIRNLAILADAINRVRKIRNIDIDIEEIPQDDKGTFEMLARGETMGVFQLSGSGMTKYLIDLKPTKITDINAMVALYRPGPLEMIPEYIKRKHNPHLIKYLDPRMEDILDQSYGVITYQDDVMLIAVNLAGYSWVEADKLRKAMGKKIPELMEEQKKKLTEGLVKGGMNTKKIDELWGLIEPFAAYGFNKAHAASYGQLAYRTAYMKANFPQEYMSAILSAEAGDTEKINAVINECKKMNIEVLPPDINESFKDFTVVVPSDGSPSKTIRFGLATIKHLGHDVVSAIIAERKERGNFKSLENMLERITHKGINKKSLEALTKAGAFDSLGILRETILHNIDTILAYNKELHNVHIDQLSLFGSEDKSETIKFNLQEAPTLDEKQRLEWEKDLLGVYVSGHPLDAVREKLEKLSITINQINKNGRDKQEIMFAGMLDSIRVIVTKKNKQMAFIRISDLSGSIEGAVFPEVYEEARDILKEDSILLLKATVSTRNDEKTVLINKVKILT